MLLCYVNAIRSVDEDQVYCLLMYEPFLHNAFEIEIVDALANEAGINIIEVCSLPRFVERTLQTLALTITRFIHVNCPGFCAHFTRSLYFLNIFVVNKLELL